MQPNIHRQTLGDLLHRTAARLPNKPAIICGSVQCNGATRSSTACATG
jgi:hypothetical protein